MGEGCRDLREVFQVGYDLTKWKEPKRGGDSLTVEPEIEG